MLIQGLLSAALLLSDRVARNTPEAAANGEDANASETDEAELNSRIVPHDITREAMPLSHTGDRMLRICPDSAHDHEGKEDQACQINKCVQQLLALAAFQAHLDNTHSDRGDHQIKTELAAKEESIEVVSLEGVRGVESDVKTNCVAGCVRDAGARVRFLLHHAFVEKDAEYDLADQAAYDFPSCGMVRRPFCLVHY